MRGTMPPPMKTPPRAPNSRAMLPATEPRKEQNASSAWRQVPQLPSSAARVMLGGGARDDVEPVDDGDRPMEIDQSRPRQDAFRRDMRELPAQDGDQRRLALAACRQGRMTAFAHDGSRPRRVGKKAGHAQAGAGTEQRHRRAGGRRIGADEDGVRRRQAAETPGERLVIVDAGAPCESRTGASGRCPRRPTRRVGENAAPARHRTGRGEDRLVDRHAVAVRWSGNARPHRPRWRSAWTSSDWIGPELIARQQREPGMGPADIGQQDTFHTRLAGRDRPDALRHTTAPTPWESAVASHSRHRRGRTGWHSPRPIRNCRAGTRRNSRGRRRRPRPPRAARRCRCAR